MLAGIITYTAIGMFLAWLGSDAEGLQGTKTERAMALVLFVLFWPAIMHDEENDHE